ncbi:type IX secretion system membrane protein PorP/SprF [Flavobacterium sp. ASV13]|uniref:PorP/SprF family type IX secretion system membrane protein n=1 Tax=Flavobacterium sp. ASV13 TaxID=1506583 RepID=UPI0005520F84|nr:type IX secretion system membrane protein PorP/SprF [Flavobacterium sp. ASV13]
MNQKILLILISLCFFPCFAQQQSQYTQYMYNTMSINPGYIGTRGVPSVFGLYRAQWVGLEGAPETANFSIQSPIAQNGQGVGLSIINEQIGPSTETIFSIGYSRPIQLSESITMSLGVSGSIDFLQVDFNKLNVYDPDDPYFTGVLSQVSPNIGAGVYFHSDKWYLGLSIPQILETKFYDDVKISIASQKMHFYAIGGYVFKLNENIQFKPATMVKAVNGAPLAVDVSASFLFMDKLTLGVAYRWDAVVSGMAGFQISESLNIGYAYDYDVTNIGNYNGGSHEIFLRFDLLGRTKSRITSPRFF